MIHAEKNDFLNFATAFEHVAATWDDSVELTGDLASIHTHHELVKTALNTVMMHDETLPEQWRDPYVNAPRDGLLVFANMNFAKAAAAGYSGVEYSKPELYEYMHDRSAFINYLSEIARLGSVVAGRVETDLGIGTNIYADPSHYVTAGRIAIVGGRFTMHDFEREKEREVSNVKMTGKYEPHPEPCAAMKSGVFSRINSAMTTLGIKAGVTDATYDHFATMAQQRSKELVAE